MRKKIASASMAVLLAATGLGIMPAIADAPRGNFAKLDQYISGFCAKYRGADQCNEWRANHANWSSDQYRNFYRRHQSDKGFANPEAANLFGVNRDAAGGGAARDGGSE
jgi:hypothetical protein